MEERDGGGEERGKLPAGRRRLEALTQDKYSAFIIKPLQSSAFHRGSSKASTSDTCRTKVELQPGFFCFVLFCSIRLK